MVSAVNDPDAGARTNTCILITGNEELVVPLSEARQHLRIDATGSPPSHPEDDLIAAMSQSAQAEMDGWEGDLGRCLLEQTWEYQAPYFSPYGIVLPLPPLRTVVSVKYLDQAGAEQTLDPSSYRATGVGSGRPGGIVLTAGYQWPVIQAAPDAVRIRFTAGYDSVDDVPGPIKSWIKQRIGQFYDNREAIIVGTVVNPLPGMDALIDRYRVRRVFQ